jgi:unsaturated chondroitin disaccharide hydrolase
MTLRARLESTISLCDASLRRTAAKWPPESPAPIWTEDGRWYRQPEMWTDWTPGFYAGQMWILHELTGEEFWRERAEAHTRALEPRRFDRDVHDLGFIFLSSYGRWLRLLDEDDPMRARVVDTLVTAATVQSYRWNGSGKHGFIYSFNGPQSLFIDIMMNVRLLFWAARNGASGEVLARALEHSRSSALYLVRRDGPGLGDEDGSVRHEAIFNTDRGRGEFRCLSTQQGYSPFTCWSRGLAWALYGFAYAYASTGEEEFRDVAERCAGFYLKHTPESGVPHWDYGAPAIPDEPLDSSAAAITGCGLLLLAEQGVEPDRARAYRDMATRIVETLTSDDFFGPRRDGEEGLLLQGVYHRPQGWGVGGAVMWGDYFFLELVQRVLHGPLEGPGLS